MASEDVVENSSVGDDVSENASAEAMLNLSLLDPPHWGWCAAGGIADVLPPHERARRRDVRDRRSKRRSHGGMKKAIVGNDSVGERNSRSDTAALRRLEINGGNALRQSQSSSCIADEVVTSAEALKTDTIPREKPVERLVSSGEESAATRISSTEQTAGTNSHSLAAEPQKSGPPGGQCVEDIRQCDNESKINAELGTSASAVDKEQTALQCRAEPRGFTASDAGTSSRSCLPVTEENKVIEVNAVDEAGLLDMHCYHRGREGLEPRDERTGELLCDVDQTDTNSRWQPNLTATITISFPLEDAKDIEECVDDQGDQSVDPDSPSNAEQGSSGRRRKASLLEFRETMSWDLSDPRTPTAMSFASGVAREFGLGYGQSLDLAASIQSQIDDFVRRSAMYNAPLSSKDPYGNGREFTPLIPPGFSTAPRLYGHGVTEKGGGENCHSVSGKQRRGGPQRISANKRTSAERNPQIEFGVLPPHLLPKHDGPLPVNASTKIGAPVSNGVSFTTEPEFREEVLRRAKLESSMEIERLCREERDDGRVGVIEVKQNFVCHICHARKPHCAQFPCGTQSHCFCDYHCKTRLGFSIRDIESASAVLDHCPICCLACVCAKCTRRLDAVSLELKRRSIEQGTDAANTDFPGILFVCSASRPQKRADIPRGSASRRRSCGGTTTLQHDQNKAGRRGSKAGVHAEERGRRTNVAVPKVPASEFPREVCGGRDLDPGSVEDYQTLFSAKGNFVLRNKVSESRAPASIDGEVEEDGNVDYCHVCRKHGNLLCCDRCPRAFHRECVDSDTLTENDWECHVCVREKQGLPDDLVDGKESLDSICAAFVESDYQKGAVENLAVLSMIHEMVTKLIKYEFGELFRVPVDCSMVVGYNDIIKKPMDLGTIASNLVNGIYAKNLGPDQTLEDAVVAVLRDLELVWHNCFTFNYQGSAIYRMAEVHRRRSSMIRKRSFDHLLGEVVKSKVDEYVVECESQRGIVSRSDPLGGENGLNRRPNGRNKITVPFAHGGTSRRIAVLDPNSGMIVKMYRSMRGAGLAAKCLLELGYQSEYELVADHVVKGIIHRSTNDPHELLFGYRWLFYDCLLEGRVQFEEDALERKQPLKPRNRKPKGHTGFVEMNDGHAKYFFVSVEEALSHDRFPEDASIGELRKRLLAQPPGEAFSFMGCSWRRWNPNPSKRKDEDKLKPTNGKEYQASDVGIELRQKSADPLFADNTCFRKDGLESAFPPTVAIVKEDLISRRKLLGFESVNSAYQDWIATRQAAPGFPTGEPTEINYFQLYYLDGDRNIDGLVWKHLPKQEMNSEFTAKGIVETEMKGPAVVEKLEPILPPVAAQLGDKPDSMNVPDRPSNSVLGNPAGFKDTELQNGGPGIGLVNGKKSPELTSLSPRKDCADACFNGGEGEEPPRKTCKTVALRDHAQKEESLTRSENDTQDKAAMGGSSKKGKEQSHGTEQQEPQASRRRKRGRPRVRAKSDVQSNALGEKGVKRTRGGEGVIRRTPRVAKEVAITIS